MSRIAEDAILGYENSAAIDVGVNTQGEAVRVEPATSKVVGKSPQRMALEHIASSTSEDVKRLTLIYKQACDQSRQWTISSLIAALLGLLILLGGIIAMFVGYTPAGVVTSAVGMISEISATLFFRQLTKVNERVDAIRVQLHKAEVDTKNNGLYSNAED
ncbi:MAG TPA: hypothetical protein VL485_01480 [Ktedonobacteraceae bacterium]|jgi:hypothetical protein|nr:hypothetical protein [Ktedonobacteraceae bacterium]